MELKKYKKINNTKRLPGFDNGYNPMDYVYSFLNNIPQITPNFKPVTNIPNISIPSTMSTKLSYWRDVNKNALSNAGNIAMSGMAAFGAIKNAGQYNKSTNDLLNEAGTSNAVVNGIGYQIQENPDAEKEMAEVKALNKANTINAMSSGASAGSAVGSIFGPVGGAVGGIVGGIGGLVGGLFGSKKRKREARRRLLAANEKALWNNRSAASDASSKAMLLDYAEEHGDTGDDVLYAYDKGKDKTITPYGKTNEEPNSRVSVGEPVLDGLEDVESAQGYVPRTGIPHADDQPANLSDSSVVLGSDIDWRTGLTFMTLGQPYALALEKINKKYETRSNKSLNNLRGNLGNKTDELQLANINKLKEPIVEKLNDLADLLKYQHEILNNINMRQYRCGKDRSYKCGKDKYAKYDIGKESWVNNFIPNAIGAGLSMKQYFDAKDQPLHAPNIYSENPYELRGLNTLAGLRVNGYPILLLMRDAETRSNYAIDNSGGLTGAQKYLGRIANANNMYSNISNMWTNLQKENNAYKSQYAQAALNTGNAAAQRRQAANEYKENMYAKAHGARQQQMQMGMRNFMDYLNQYSANEFKRRQFNDMLGLYQADMGIKSTDKSKGKGLGEFLSSLFKKKGGILNGSQKKQVNMNIGDISKDYYAKINAPKESLRRGIPYNFIRSSDIIPSALNSDMSTNIHSRMNIPNLTFFRNSRYSGNIDEIPGRTPRDFSGFYTTQPNMPQRIMDVDIADLTNYASRISPQQYNLGNTRRKLKGGLDYLDFMRQYLLLNSGRMNVLPN